MCVCTHTQPCLTLCDSMVCSPPGSSVLGIFQSGILEWISISYSRGPSQPRDWICVLHLLHLAGGFFTTAPPGKPLISHTFSKTDPVLCLVSSLFFYKDIIILKFTFRLANICKFNWKQLNLQFCLNFEVIKKA